MLDKKHYILIGATVFFGLTSMFTGYKFYTISQREHHRHEHHQMRMKRPRKEVIRRHMNMHKGQNQKPNNHSIKRPHQNPMSH